jgi:hypothetical protein
MFASFSCMPGGQADPVDVNPEPVVSGRRVVDAVHAHLPVAGHGRADHDAAALRRGPRPEIIRAARDVLPNPDASVTSIAKLLGISPGTLYNHIPDLRELRASGRLQHQVTAAAASQR